MIRELDMDITTKIEASTTLVSTGALLVKKSAFSGSVFYSMIIFTDPAYIIIATLGAFVSMGSAYYDYLTLKKQREGDGEKCEKSLRLELAKAFLAGLIVTVLSFMLFHKAGGDIMQKVTGFTWFKEMLPSFWLILTIALATESVSIWDKAKAKLKGFFS